MSTPELEKQFLWVIEQNKGIIYKIANSFKKDDDDKKDLVQEIILQLWRSFPSYDARSKLSTWIYRVALNVAITSYRKEKIKKKFNTPFSESIMVFEQEPYNEKDGNLALLQQFINELRELDRALMLLYLEEKNGKEMAEILGFQKLTIKIMNELDIKQLWQAYDAKLERSLQLNEKIIKEIQTQKAENNISSFRRSQVTGVVIGLLWVLLLVFLTIAGAQNIYFAGSMGIIALFNILAVATYIRHLALLDQVNIADNITGAQQKLATIQVSLNNVSRIMILQAPLWCTFWYSQQLVDHAGLTFWLINLAVVSCFVVLSVYLYQKLSYKNIHIKWVKAFVESFGGKKLSSAMEFLHDIEAYKAESPGKI
eukprot:gene16544-19659_t